MVVIFLICIDSGGLELWFGDLAWSLGHKFNSGPAFHRHQFFKISYKLLSLTPEKVNSCAI